MSTNPPLTVILPARNAEATIASAIASTLNQSYTDFELWVLESRSNDLTAEVARSFTDPRIKVFELGPTGFQGALQYAIENASSEWLARMDADDLMFPDRLKVQMEVIAQRPDLVLIGTAYALLTPFGHIFERVSSGESREIDTSILGWGRSFADASTIFRRRIALDVGGVDPEFTIGDVPLWFRMLAKGKGWEIGQPLYLAKLHPGSMSGNFETYRQGVGARAKYASQTLDHWLELQKRQPSPWRLIAILEMLAGDGNSARKAANFLEQEGVHPRTAQKIRWLSYFGRAGYHCYRLRNRHRHRYRHRPDWEKFFSPLLSEKHGFQTAFQKKINAQETGVIQPTA